MDFTAGLPHQLLLHQILPLGREKSSLVKAELGDTFTFLLCGFTLDFRRRCYFI